MKNACEQVFVDTATVDEATVLVAVTVAENSAVRKIVVIYEIPSGQGFAAAAKMCMAESTFAPAVDGSGKAIAGAGEFYVRFAR